MASSLKRVVDYKLIYDGLADPSNGMIRLTTLTTRWPRDLAASKLPRGLLEQWRSAADDNGYLDWERFSSALRKAIEEDKPRLSKSQTPTKADEKLLALQQQRGTLAPRVRAEEIEAFLSSCGGEVLAQALSRTRKEVYKCQMSLHQLESSSSTTVAASSSGQSNPSNTSGHVKVPLVNALSTVGQEKEELLKGMEVMEITRLWFNSRLEQLALEEKQPTKKVKPEELLAALERKEGQPVSETLKHIQEINSHLGKLATNAPGISLEQLQKKQRHQQQNRIKTVVSDPGPFSHSKEWKATGQGGGAPVRASATVQMNFPAYSPANVTGPSPRVSPVRSSSMREVHTIRGETETEPIRPTHRVAVSSSTQNLMTDQRHESQGHYHHHHHQRSNKPRRSHSFTERSSSSYSSSSGSTSGSGSMATEHTKTSPSHGGYGTLNQYPLRETASLQTLPSSASYGNGPDGHHVHHKHHASHSHHGHSHGHGQRSSSVRNIPSASGYNTATGSGRPIISQSTSGARVESVDIPSHPPPAAMATHDLSSSYPGHHVRGSRTGGGHTHGGTRGENPKASRRHLHKAVQEQSLRIKQLEAENAALTRDHGYRGQKQQQPASATGHPVIKTSALQSVV